MSRNYGVGSAGTQAIFSYLAEAHLEPGRTMEQSSPGSAMRPISVHGYSDSQAFFNFLVAEEVIATNPMARIKPPSAKTEIKQPVNEEHIKSC
jgi:site-specific recombinase XerD